MSTYLRIVSLKETVVLAALENGLLAARQKAWHYIGPYIIALVEKFLAALVHHLVRATLDEKLIEGFLQLALVKPTL